MATSCAEECDFRVDQVDETCQNGNEDNKAQYLLELRNLIEEREECNRYTFDDNFLLRFLRSRDFVIRHAHRLLINYCKFKRNNTEYYANVKLKNIEADEVISFQPLCDSSNRRIFMYKLANWNPEICSFQELVQHTILALELFILEPRTQILGGICVFDLKGIKKRHLKFITLKFITQMLDILLWSFPIRIHGVHIVNFTDATDFDFSMVKLFMNSEAKRRIISHGADMKSLHEHVDPKYLPKRYGGIREGLRYGKWFSNLLKTDDGVSDTLSKIGYCFVG